MTLRDAETLERSTTHLVTAMARTADLEGIAEMLRRVAAMRQSEADLELQVAELSLAVLLDPENLRSLLRGVDCREFLDRRQLGELLALLGPTAAPEAANWLMETRHPKEVAQALRVFGDEAAEALVPLYQEASTEERDRIGPAFLEIGTPEAFQALAADFPRLSERSRLHLIQVIGRTKDAELRDVIVSALEDRSERVRRAAVGAMRSADAPSVAAALAGMFEREIFSRRTRSEVNDFFEMLARIANAELAGVLAAQCVPKRLFLASKKLTPLQELCLRALRRVRAPDARAVVDHLRAKGPKAVRDRMNDPLADL
jgi:HEAT repeat protein